MSAFTRMTRARALFTHSTGRLVAPSSMRAPIQLHIGRTAAVVTPRAQVCHPKSPDNVLTKLNRMANMARLQPGPNHNTLIGSMETMARCIGCHCRRHLLAARTLHSRS